MRRISRRTALKGALLGGAAAAGLTGGPRAAAGAATAASQSDSLMGLLYDATLCIGCKACVVACKEANGMPAETRGPGGLYDRPDDLSSKTRNIIKLYQTPTEQSYIKRQCMHCLDPACASACMLGALKKREFGIVTYDPTFCIGCRYCEIGCPFGVPKFEWEKAAPKIVKCELCNHRLARGQEPACSDVCPRAAVIFGKREDLLREAKRRIAESPGRYIPKVYGEFDGGGTQVLYLSHVDFDKVGLPALGDEPVAQRARSIQHGVYRGFIAPAALYAALSVVMIRNRRKNVDDVQS